MQSTVLLTWGLNNNMTLGHADEVSRSHPDEVCAFLKPTCANIAQVVLSKFHSVFLVADGKVFTCGHGHGGRLGHGDEQSHVIPYQIKTLCSVKCVGVAAARDHTVFLSDGGEVFTCGLNDCCQLGHGSTLSAAYKQSLFPRRVKFFKGQKVTQVAAGRYHTAVCTKTGLFTWGQNEGQLGYLKTDVTQSTPKQVTHLPKGCEIVLLCASDSATACCTGDGEIFVLHDYTCRKISITPFGLNDLPVKLCISACLGHLDNAAESLGPTVLLALTKHGEVWKWTPGHRVMFRCRWLNKNGHVRTIQGLPLIN
jgi:alpha-tubulin suppressor-like RCC1 family protein